MRKPHDITATLCCLVFSTAATAAPVINTASGPVSGISQRGVRAFLGIPYAKAPVGNLRWRETEPTAPWRIVRAATRLAPSCLQNEPKPFGPYTVSFLIAPERSEDCLYLNVWSPTNTSGKKPVYFFIHGGAFQAGGANVPAYDGSGLAKNGAVVVTLNYRLGVFGFLAHPELTRESSLGSSGNYGLLDIIAALRWVRANIAHFGGDPTNVTIAGQSAGAVAVSDLLVSPLAKGLFHRAVIQSGPVMNLPITSTLVQAERAGTTFAAGLKADNIAALRALPAADVAKGALAGIPWPNIDGKVVLSNPELPNVELISNVPVIAGYMRDEAADVPRTKVAFEEDVRKRFGAFADKFLALYPHANDAEAAISGPQLARERYIAALLLWAQRRAATGQLVYAYVFEHRFPGVESEKFGAFHTADIPYVFGALSLPGAKFTDHDRQISSQIQKRWIAFMQSGNPNSTGSRVPWPQSMGEPGSVWRIGGADTGPAIDTERMALFRDYVAQGGKLGLF